MEINFFSSEIEKFIAACDVPSWAKIMRTLDLLEKFGHQLGMPHSKKIEEGIFELRCRGKKEIRILYCFCRGAAVLLHVIHKKSQKLPRAALKLAQKRHALIDEL